MSTYYIYRDITSTGITLGVSESMTVSSGGTVNNITVASGGKLSVNSGGVATGITQKAGGVVVVNVTGNDTVTKITGTNAKGKFSLANGIATNFIAYSGGDMHVSSGGVVSNTTVSCGGNLYVDSGGTAGSTIVSSGGYLYVWEGGTLNGAVIYQGGEVDCWPGVKMSNVVYKGWKLTMENTLDVKSGVSAVKTRVSSGGELTVGSGGTTSSATVLSGGKISVSSSGKDSNTTIRSGGLHYVVNGGRANNTTIEGGIQGVRDSGSIAKNTVVNSNGSQFIADGGRSYSAIINDGAQVLSQGCVASHVVVGSNGIQVNLGGVTKKTLLHSGGALAVTAGKTSSVSAAKGSVISAAGGCVFYGKNVLHGGVLMGGGTKANKVKLANKGSLIIDGAADISNLHLKLAAGSILSLSAPGNTLASLKTVATSRITYDISGRSASSKKYLLSVNSVATQKGTYTVIVKNGQQLGSYKLSKNIVLAESTSFIIQQGSTAMGTAKLNAYVVKKNGVNYTVNGTQNTITLMLTVAGGSMKLGNAKANELKGTVHSDIFYGGKGNDNITGVNGRDVAVYNKTAWGKDTIAATNGTMTLVLAGIKKSQVTRKLSSDTLIIKRKGTSQKITVKGWNADTHKIVYNAKLPNFTAYVKAASPTAEQKQAARTEVWQKAGLASA